jgi:hypothetical protein
MRVLDVPDVGSALRLLHLVGANVRRPRPADDL